MQYTLEKDFPLDIIKQLNKLSDELIRETEIESFNVYTGSQRYKVYEKDNFRCKQCGVKGLHAKLVVTKFEDSKSERGHFVVIAEDSRLLTKDHIYPKSRGGKNKMENLQCLCNVCNEAKGNNTEDMDEGVIISKCKITHILSQKNGYKIIMRDIKTNKKIEEVLPFRYFSYENRLNVGDIVEYKYYGVFDDYYSVPTHMYSISNEDKNFNIYKQHSVGRYGFTSRLVNVEP